MEGRSPVFVKTLAEYQSHPEVEQEAVPPDLTMYGNFKYDGYKWGMAIDLNACIGCKACVRSPARRKTIFRWSERNR